MALTPIYAAAKRHFGTWQWALQAAGQYLDGARGFSKSLPRRKQRIMWAIMERRKNGLSLAWSQVCLEKRALATAAKTVFGSWRRALAAAETASAEELSTTRRRWSKDRIIEEIKRRSEHNSNLRYNAARFGDAALLSAARWYFGSWKQALAEAGIDIS